MCQAYEGEARYVAGGEKREIMDKWNKHESGEAPLTDDEIKELAIRKMMLMDGGYW